MVIYRVIEEAGGSVVDDLLDIGGRYFAGSVSLKDDPVAAMADRLLSLLPTPAKHNPVNRRGKYLIDRVTRHRADGVIFARQKFCDPHGFDYVQLKYALDRAKIPNLLVETEQSTQLGQMRTRIEAFLEMIRGY